MPTTPESSPKVIRAVIQSTEKDFDYICTEYYLDTGRFKCKEFSCSKTHMRMRDPSKRFEAASANQLGWRLASETEFMYLFEGWKALHASKGYTTYPTPGEFLEGITIHPAD